MEQQLNQLSADEMDDSSLLDCYRIALDFGMPAALKAYEKLALTTVHKSSVPLISINEEVI